MTRKDRIRAARSVADLQKIMAQMPSWGIALSTSEEPASVLIDHTATIRTGQPTARAPIAVIPNFKSPNVGLVRKHTAALQILHETSSDLDAITASLKHTFHEAKDAPAALKAVAKMKMENDAAYADAASALNAVAEKHVPKQLEEFASALQNQLISMLPADSYDDISMELYVSAHDVIRTELGAKRTSIEFVYYLVVSKLRTDSDDGDNTVDEFCIMLTGAVEDSGVTAAQRKVLVASTGVGEETVRANSKLSAAKFDEAMEQLKSKGLISTVSTFALKPTGKEEGNEGSSVYSRTPHGDAALKGSATVHFYLNAIPEFLPPGKYPVGKEIDSLRGAKARLALLLSIHKIVRTLEHRPMPYTNESPKIRAIARLKGVSSATVVDDTLVVQMTPGIVDEQSVNFVVTQVLPLLATISGTRKSSPVRAQYETLRQPARKELGAKVPEQATVVFSLVSRAGRSKESAATVHSLNDMQAALGLTDAEAADIKQVLMRHRV